MGTPSRVDPARLLFPAVRWHERDGFTGEAGRISRALEVGVGGFILFGGPADAVRELTLDLQVRSRWPLLIGSDLERGAGQQFEGATQLPPLAAFGALDDVAVTRQAGALTAREALALGINWVYAPVADLDVEPRNPIVGTRAFSARPDVVARHVRAWIEGCRAEGALCCVKHFPGHGRTTTDSHAELPVVEASRSLLEADLEPFRAAVDAAADSMMTAHVLYTALDPAAPATLSRAIVTGLLRDEMRYDGLVVTDSLTMEGILADGRGESVAAVDAVAAGCDALLYPEDLEGVASALGNAIAEGRLPESRVREALARIDRVLARTHLRAEGNWGAAADLAWAAETAGRSIVHAGAAHDWPAALDLVTLDDDLGGPFAAPPRTVLGERLRGHGFEIRDVPAPEPGRPALVALYADVRAWKARAGVADDTRDALARMLQGDVRVVLFTHPRLAAGLRLDSCLCAWGGEAVMQSAVADWIARRRTP
jgi:beta-glucosidase-like glycosyl hydrolase